MDKGQGADLEGEAVKMMNEREKARFAYTGLDEQLNLRFRAEPLTPRDRIAVTTLRIKDEVTEVLGKQKDPKGIPPKLAALIVREQSEEKITAVDLVDAAFEMISVSGSEYRSGIPPHALAASKATLLKMLEGKEIRLTDPTSLRAFFTDVNASLYGGKKEALKRAFGEEYIDPDTPQLNKEMIESEFTGDVGKEMEALLIRIMTNMQTGKISAADARAILNFFNNKHSQSIDDLNQGKKWMTLFSPIATIPIQTIGNIISHIAILAAQALGIDINLTSKLSDRIMLINCIVFSLLLIIIMNISAKKNSDEIKELFAQVEVSSEMDDILMHLKEVIDLLETITQKKEVGISTAKDEETIILIFQKIEELKRRREQKLRIQSKTEETKKTRIALEENEGNSQVLTPQEIEAQSVLEEVATKKNFPKQNL